MDGTNLRSFEQEWPDLAARLHRALASKGVPPWQRDDAVQEVGLKLLRIWDEVDPERSPFGLALTMAKNSLWDQTHRGSGRELVGEVPERIAPHGVEEIGLARLEVARVGRLLKQLSAEHRSVLLAEVGAAAPPIAGTAAATKMLRLRARRRLGALMEQTPVAITTPALGLRDLARRVSDALRRNQWLTDLPGTAAAGAIVMAGLIALPPAGAAGLSRTNTLPDAVSARAAQPLDVRVDEGLHGLEQGLQELGARKVDRGKKAANRTTRESSRYEVEVGEGTPVHGYANADITPEENDGYLEEPPSCRHEASTGGAEVTCTVKTRTRTIRVQVGVKPGP